MNNVVNQMPYIRSSREFPLEIEQLTVEVDRAYVDIANAVNNRVIGLFPTTRPAITGESWFITNNQKQQTIRQIYTFTAAGSINHGITTSSISGFTRIYGTFTDGSTWYPLPYVDVAAANAQVNITVTSTQIVITAGGGAPPTITQGYVVLEWLSNV